MGDKDPYGLVPSRDAALRSPSSPSDLVESSENGKFSSFFTAFLLQFLSFKKYFYPFEKNDRIGEEVFPFSQRKRGNESAK